MGSQRSTGFQRGYLLLAIKRFTDLPEPQAIGLDEEVMRKVRSSSRSRPRTAQRASLVKEAVARLHLVVAP